MNTTTLRHEIWIDAPRKDVYLALSQPENVSQWWDEQTERRLENGDLIWEHSPGPEHGAVQFKIVERSDNSLIRWECVSQHPVETPGYAWTGTKIRFEFKDRVDYAPADQKWASETPAQNVLQFQHACCPLDDPYLGFCNSAWGCVLNNLKSHCENSEAD